MQFIDTHCHLDGEEFRDDLDAVVTRAREAGVAAIGVPGINLESLDTVLELCRRYPYFCYPMLGLHPEDVKADWRDVLAAIKPALQSVKAVGEVGLDYYWSREFEKEQFQNDLPGGVFHCFTGNEHEAAELLQFDKFVLGIGGVSTFKKSHLPEVLPAVVPLDRIVLETDAPYMAPVPKRGERNEPAFVAYVLKRLAEAYGVSEEEVAQKTNENVARVLGIIL